MPPREGDGREGSDDLSAERMTGQGQTRDLRRELGLREAVALGIGGTVGGGIFVLVGAAAGLAGPAALVAFLAAFAAALVIALPYAELSCRLPLAGGGYAFARKVLGPHWGFVMGWGYWGAYVFVSGYVTIGFGGYLQAATGLPAAGGAVALVAASTALNLLGVKVSGRVQALVVLVAVAGLAGFVLWGLPHVALERLEPFLPYGPLLGLYLLVAVVALGTVPAARLGVSAAPLAEAAAAFAGQGGRHLVVLIALLTTAATANAVLVVTSRIVFAMARDGLLPERLAAVRAATGAPWAAVLASGLLLAIVGAAGTVAFAAAAGGFLYVLHFVPPLVALVVLRRRGGARPAFTTPAPRLLIPLAFVASAALVTASGTTGIVFGSGWLVVGLALYRGGAGLRGRRRSTPRRHRR